MVAVLKTAAVVPHIGLQTPIKAWPSHLMERLGTKVGMGNRV